MNVCMCMYEASVCVCVCERDTQKESESFVEWILYVTNTLIVAKVWGEAE